MGRIGDIRAKPFSSKSSCMDLPEFNWRYSLELRSEGYSYGNDAGDKRTFAKLADFFSIELFFAIVLLSALNYVSTIIAEPTLCGAVHRTGFVNKYRDAGMSTVWGYIKSTLSTGLGCHLKMTVQYIWM